MNELSDPPQTSNIDRLHFVLKTDNELASALQQRCSVLFHQQLRAQLANLFMQCASRSPGAVLIDRLTLDLGQISEAEFEVQLSERLLRQLAQQLLELFSSATNLAPGEMLWKQGTTMSVIAAVKSDRGAESRARAHAEADAVAQNEGKPSATNATQRNDPIAQFVRYLQTGYLAQPRIWQDHGGPDNWLLTQLEQAPSRWLIVLAHNCLRQGPLRRLRQTFSAPTLHRVGQLLTADVQSLPGGSPLSSAVALEGAEGWSLYLALSALLFFHARAAAPSATLPGSVPSFPAPTELQDVTTPVLKHWLRNLTAQARPRSRAMMESIQVLLDSVLQSPPNEFPNVSTTQPTESAQSVQSPMTKSATPLGTEAMPVSNAGIVLLWPFLPGWLGRLGLLHTVEDKPGFIDEQAQMQAVRWLDNLVWGGDINEIAEWRMLLNKLLCGMSLDAALPESSWRASEAIVVALRDQCLASLPAQLPGLQRCGAGDIRSMFLQRPGQLQWRSDQLGTEPHWQLNVEQDASDILLRELPWPLEQVIFPWLEQPLSINWL